jgi:hypothetical protein
LRSDRFGNGFKRDVEVVHIHPGKNQFRPAEDDLVCRSGISVCRNNYFISFGYTVSSKYKLKFRGGRIKVKGIGNQAILDKIFLISFVFDPVIIQPPSQNFFNGS